MLLVTLFVISFATLAAGERIIGTPGNGEKIPFDITVKDGYIITVSGRPNTVQPYFRQSINLYDFDKHLEARKVVEEDTCYIRKFEGTFAQAVRIVNAAKGAKQKVTSQVTEDWNIRGEEIPADQLEATVGPKIANFCSGYRVFWVKENKGDAGVVKRQWTASGGGGYTPGGGFSANGGLKYDNGKGLSANLGGGWSQGGGWSASAGLTWKFGK